MILAIDAGNTIVEIGVLPVVQNHLEIIASARFFTKMEITSDEFAVFILNFLKIHDIQPQQIKSLIYSSVVPPLDNMIYRMFADYFNGPIMQVTEKTKLNVRNCYQNPSEVGSDRLVGACYAAYHYKNQNAIVVDLGTATTICAIKSNGDYLGGIICSGMATSVNALTKKEAKLPAIRIIKKDKILGDNTIQALESGIYFSTLYALKGMIKKLAEEVGFSQYVTIGAGGFANIFVEDNIFDVIEDKMLLKGLKIIADINQS
ncbi:MAG: type III pantothenate kinase [Spirochaetes bacterium]|nr:type III pantothenate kinase [Spirochaetota bacterium]